MTKQEFQTIHGFTSQEMELISAMLTTTKGQIVSIKPVPTQPDGTVVPFNERK